MKIALIQLNATHQKTDNIRRAKEFVQEAAAKGASWILLPEMFAFRGNLLNQETLSQVPEPIPGPTTQEFQHIATELKVDILLGSIVEEGEIDKPHNTSVFIRSNSKGLSKYRKIHLFDAVVDDKIVREGDYFSRGFHGEIVNIEELKIGLSVCYDVRFPEMYQKYTRQGTNVLTVPSCFTKTTGQAHWESLLRTRAIENLSYVLAPNQVGFDSKGIEAHGHSMVVSPWGEIIACGSAGQEEIVYADINIETIKQARAKLPGIVKE